MKTVARSSKTLLLAAIATLALAACAGSAETGGEISAEDVRTPVPVGPNGAVYMTLTNESDADDRLVGASTDVAASVELHETQMEGGSMAMQQVDGIAIPAGGEAVLEPGGLHVMLIDVDQGLAEGDTVDLTLSFENAGDQQVTADVVPLGEEPAMEMGSEAMEMGSEMDGMDMESEG